MHRISIFGVICIFLIFACNTLLAAVPTPALIVLNGIDFKGGAAELFGSNFNGEYNLNYVYAEPSGPHSLMSSKFNITSITQQKLFLHIKGLDDDGAGKCNIAIDINGHIIFEGPNDFSETEWQTLKYPIPSDVLKTDENIITIACRDKKGQVGNPPWFQVSKCIIAEAEYIIIKDITKDFQIDSSQKKRLFPEPLKPEQKPGFMLRGIKSWMWTPEQCIAEIPVLARYKMNFFMNCYTTMGDIKQFRGKYTWGQPEVNRWWEDLSESRKNAFEAIVRECRKYKIDFCFSMNPNLSSSRPLNYYSDKDIDDLWKHYKWMQNLGVKWFNISLDDISQGIDPSGQARVVNEIYRRLKESDPQVKMIFCPTIYWGDGTPQGDRQYLETIARELDKEVWLFWTGNSVVGNITRKSAESYRDISKHRLILWDNYPVNDANPTMHLGPVTKRDLDLCEVVDGYMSNSLCPQTEGNRIPMLTCADYAYNPYAYDPARSVSQAILHLESTSEKQQIIKDLVQLYPGFIIYGKPSTGLNPVREHLTRVMEIPHSRYIAESMLRHLCDISERMDKAFPNRYIEEKKTLKNDIEFIKNSISGSKYAESPEADFYVAVNGSDKWTGRISAPLKDGTDGPFATIKRAQQAVRQLKESSPGRSITVMVRGGRYCLSEPIVFTPDDSGSADSQITYTAYPGEKPIFSGGILLNGWKMDNAGRWTLTIPQVISDEWNFQQLFVNNERRYRPRLPKTGYYYIDGEVSVPKTIKWGGPDRFRFKQGDINPDWVNLNDIDLLCFHYWTMSRMHIASVDEQKNHVLLTGQTAADAWWSALSKNVRYIAENVKEALRSPGEWYLDRKSGQLTYIPKRNEDIRKTEIIAPRLNQLLLLKGDPDNRKWVEHINFNGLSFTHTNWITPPQGNSIVQSEVTLDAAVSAIGARNCVFESCEVSHTGEYAIEFGKACKSNRVDGCRLTDLGAGGVKIGEVGPSGESDLLASHNTVRNTIIAHGGRVHPAGVGVWIGSSPYNIVSHNDITDFYYTGISAGWKWDYETTYGHHNRIEDNHIWNIGQGVMSDMGGIYHLGVAHGTVIRHNLIHDISHSNYGGWGIYLDASTTGVLVEDNIVYNAVSGSFHQNFGKDNIIRNNIFAMSDEAQILRSVVEPHKSFEFRNNIIYWKKGALLGGDWSGNNYQMDNNIFWNASGKQIDFLGKSLDQWRQNGQDEQSIIVDPVFVNPDRGDFRLKSDSPAPNVGFTPIESNGFGRTGYISTDISNSPRAFPAAEVHPLSDDFESTPASESAPGATTVSENQNAVISVTDEESASGKHSLKFSDTEGQQHQYNPHTFYNTSGIYSNVLVGKFSIYMKPGAVLFHEWRSSGLPPYFKGPSIRIEGDGSLLAGGRKIASIPLDQWVRLEIRCKMGDNADGKYDLAVYLPNTAVPLRFLNLPCDPYFREVKWFGFSSDSNRSSTFYIDDIWLGPESMIQ
ncbi:MAG: beta-N-acetylglucosaminidase domain-containing protein [Armatimonadota bacterium]